MMNRFRLRRIEAILSRLTTPQQESAAVAPRSLRSAHDVIALLHEQIEALRAAWWIGTLEKARAIGYLASISRKAIETGKVAARLEELEAVLQQRHEGDLG